MDHFAKEQENDSGKEKEFCVVCGRDTGYLRETPIWQRRNYIEGAGQLCQKCFTELYVTRLDR